MNQIPSPLEIASSRLKSVPAIRREREVDAVPLILKRVIEYAVGVVFEVEVRELRSPTRGTADAAFARQVAMYLAHVACGLSFSEIGRVFARDRTTVSHACHVVEDSRDNPRTDRTLDLMEAVVGRLAHVTLFGSSRLN
jgi:chromosomal replication initiation ATPase DnaA